MLDTLPQSLNVISFPTARTLQRDLRATLKTSAPMTRDEARYLVDTYYQLQNFRIAAAGQLRAQSASNEPAETLAFFSDH